MYTPGTPGIVGYRIFQTNRFSPFDFGSTGSADGPPSHFLKSASFLDEKVRTGFPSASAISSVMSSVFFNSGRW